jgi:hypothetical protein
MSLGLSFPFLRHPSLTFPLAVAMGSFLVSCSRESNEGPSAADVRGEPIKALSASESAASAVVPPDPPTAASVGSNAAVGAPASAATPPESDTYEMVGFDKLSSFNFEISDEILGPITNDVAVASAKTESLIPRTVKALDQKRVELKGFMLPLKVEGGLVTEMLIMKDQSMCCYGVVPKINEWVSVKMVSKGVRPVMDEAVRLFGTLRVGEMRENGYLVGIYRLDGERMASAVE